MTKEEFLAGATDPNVPSESQRKAEVTEWEAYKLSDEGFEEMLALIEMGCYDGPTGDA